MKKRNESDAVLVSIIIPTYNVEKYLRSCLNSVLQQLVYNIEIICVEDGSTDQTLGIIREYCRIDNRIKLVNYDGNKGTAYARNRGLEVATGKYAYFLDADDLVKPEIFLKLIDYADKNETDCIYFNSELQVETEGIGGPKLDFDLPQLEGRLMSGEKLFAVLIKNQSYTGSVCRQFWRRKFLVENNLFFPNGYLGEDALFSFKAMLAGKKMMIVNEKYHIYRRHGGTMSTNVSSRKAISLFRTYCQMLEIWMRGNYDEEVNQAIKIRCEHFFMQTRQLYLRNKNNITVNDFQREIEKHLFKLLLEQTQNNSVTIEKPILECLKKYNTVIVYGAAGYAVNVVEALSQNGVKVSCLAVTTVHENTMPINDIPVYEIGSLREVYHNAIVVLGVVKKNRDDVIKTLEINGFKDYIELD